MYSSFSRAPIAIMSLIEMSPDVLGLICRTLTHKDTINLLSTCKTLNAVKLYGPLVVRPKMWGWWCVTERLLKSVFEDVRFPRRTPFRRALLTYIECIVMESRTYSYYDFLYTSIEVAPQIMVTLHLPTILPRLSCILTPVYLIVDRRDGVEVIWKRDLNFSVSSASLSDIFISSLGNTE